MNHHVSDVPAGQPGLALRTNLRGGNSTIVGPCTCNTYKQYLCWNSYGQQTVLTDPEKARDWEKDGNCRVPQYSLLGERNCGCREEESPWFCRKGDGPAVQIGNGELMQYLIKECGARFGPGGGG